MRSLICLGRRSFKRNELKRRGCLESANLFELDMETFVCGVLLGHMATVSDRVISSLLVKLLAMPSFWSFSSSLNDWRLNKSFCFGSCWCSSFMWPPSISSSCESESSSIFRIFYCHTKIELVNLCDKKWICPYFISNFLTVFIIDIININSCSVKIASMVY